VGAGAKSLSRKRKSGADERTRTADLLKISIIDEMRRPVSPTEYREISND
jgi:hypothetical protein